MNTPLRLTCFVALLAAVFAISFGVGNAVGPIGDTDPEPDPVHHMVTTEPVDDR